MSRDEWIEAFAAELGISPPIPEQADAILELAAIAAHASERTAAPIATWLAGASGRPVQELCKAADKIATAEP